MPTIPHSKSFAARPSASLVLLGHTRPIPYYQQGEAGEEQRACVSQGMCFLTFRGPLASHDSNPYPNRCRIARYYATKIRERKMRTKFFCTNFLNTPKGPGHPGKIPGTSRIPLFETQGRQSFEGGHEVFGHHPFAWKTPTPPGGLRTQKLNLCALFSCLIR